MTQHDYDYTTTTSIQQITPPKIDYDDNTKDSDQRQTTPPTTTDSVKG